MQQYAREAGVHIYDELSDSVFANENYLAITVWNAGQRTIRLPKEGGASGIACDWQGRVHGRQRAVSHPADTTFTTRFHESLMPASSVWCIELARHSYSSMSSLWPNYEIHAHSPSPFLLASSLHAADQSVVIGHRHAHVAGHSRTRTHRQRTRVCVVVYGRSEGAGTREHGAELCYSDDGGRTFTQPEAMGAAGQGRHALLRSDGVDRSAGSPLVCLQSRQQGHCRARCPTPAFADDPDAAPSKFGPEFRVRLRCAFCLPYEQSHGAFHG